METNETIQPDVSESVEDQVVDTPESSEEELPKNYSSDPVTKREQKMADMAEKRRAEQAAERTAAAEMDRLPEEEEESPPEEAPTSQEDTDPTGRAEDLGTEEVAPSTQETPATSSGWRTGEDGTRIKTLMVNGEAKDFTEEQYDRMIQKDLAGDQKLRMASELDRQLKERARQLEEKERQISAPPPPPEGASEELTSAISQYQDALLDGDTDVAAKKMAEIIGLGRQSSTPNMDLIVSQATTRMRQEVQQEQHNESVQTGWVKFQAEYQDVLADPDAMAFADIQIKKLRADPAMRPEDVLLEAGKITRERLRLSGGTQEEPVQQDDGDVIDLRAERAERKANLKPIPKAAVVSKRKEAPKIDMSPEAKIARMRQSRFK